MARLHRPNRARAVATLFVAAPLVAPLLVSACGSETPQPQAPVTFCSASGSARVVGTVAASTSASSIPTVAEARAFVDGVEKELRKLWVLQAQAGWAYETNITDDTEALETATNDALGEFTAKATKEAARFAGLTLPPDLARKIYLLRVSVVAPAPADASARGELAKIGVELDGMYGKGKFCAVAKDSAAVRWTLAHDADARKKATDPKAPVCLDLDALETIMGKSRDFETLLDAFRGWNTVGKPMRAKYARAVDLMNEGAREIGFSDTGVLWRSGYDMTPEAFEADTERLWSQVKPLYDDLHCYARSRLRKVYGKEKIPEHAPIPANLLGNMWAQEWDAIYDLLEPYKGEGSLDATPALKAKKIDEKGMVRLGEHFYTSLGFDPLPTTFWERSLFKKPTDRDVVCHAEAMDVGFDNDLRIKMCVEPTELDLTVIHHELGHDYYFNSYYTQPILFQNGANDGFHEAIGDTIALSVTPKYLKELGLLTQLPKNDHGQINVLMKRALGKVAFLPFGKLIDQWRWDVFSGKTPASQYESAWWALRQKYQGVSSPMPTSEEDFSPGAKFHVPANTPYTRYFLAAIYQFQFHRALCKIAGQTGPLASCSIYGSKEAGARLKAMLSLGASEPWPKALEALSGETQADASAMLEYFAPLQTWLKEQNKGETCGW